MQTFVENPYGVIGRWFADPSAPAWIQAVGSIAVIVATFAFIFVQREIDQARDRTARQEQRSQRERALLAFIYATAQRALGLIHLTEVQSITTNAELGAFAEHGKRELASFRDLTARFDVTVIDDARVWAAWASFAAELNRMDSMFDWWSEHAGKYPELGGNPIDDDIIPSMGRALKLLVRSAEIATEHIKSAAHL